MSSNQDNNNNNNNDINNNNNNNNWSNEKSFHLLSDQLTFDVEAVGSSSDCKWRHVVGVECERVGLVGDQIGNVLKVLERITLEKMIDGDELSLSGLLVI